MAYNNIHNTLPQNNQQGKSTKKLYLSSLPSTVSENKLKMVFGRFGKVHSIKLSRDSRNGFCRGFGSITFKNEINLEKILSMDLKIMGRSISCEPFIERERDLELRKIINSRRRVFVSNIPTWMTNQNLRQFFSQYGDVVSAYRIEQHGSMKKMPFGYIYFEDISAAEKCLEEGFKFMGIRYGFMLFDKYTKDKQERQRMRKIRDAKINSFKESIKQIDFKHYENNYSYRNQQSSNIRNPDHYGKVEIPRSENFQYRGQGNPSLLHNLNSIRNFPAEHRIHETERFETNEDYQMFRQRKAIAKMEQRQRRLRELEFNMLKPTSSKYWSPSFERTHYFETRRAYNYRQNYVIKQ